MNHTAPPHPIPQHYLDHAATTPPRPAALDAFARAATNANPSSLHAAGRRARRSLEESREQVAALLGAHPSEVVFTSGGTESDNLGVLGAARAAAAAGHRPRVLVAAAEHHSVLDAAAQAGREGIAVDLLPVRGDAAVDLPAAARAVAAAAGSGERPCVAVMAVNNEIGTRNPVADVAELLREHRGTLHVDAVQAAGHLPLDFAASGATTMSLSGHKFGAPLGIGVLLARRDAELQPLGFGGGQERDLRSGSVNVPGAVALAVALREACDAMADESRRLSALRDRLVAGIRAAVPDAELAGPPLETDATGSMAADAQRHPGIANFVFPGRAGESLLLLLDAEGICVSTGSACTAGVAEASHVHLATGRCEAEARAALRFSLGWTTTDADIEAVLATIGAAAERARTSGVVTNRLRPGR